MTFTLKKNETVISSIIVGISRENCFHSPWIYQAFNLILHRIYWMPWEAQRKQKTRSLQMRNSVCSIFAKYFQIVALSGVLETLRSLSVLLFVKLHHSDPIQQSFKIYSGCSAFEELSIFLWKTVLQKKQNPSSSKHLSRNQHKESV